MEDQHEGYQFPHHIVLSHIGFWTVAEILAWRVYPIRVSCKRISLLHCILAFAFSSAYLVYRFILEEGPDDQQQQQLQLYNFAVPGTIEHHIISFSMAYFIVDMPFCLTFHQTFIIHHVLCIISFAAIQGYWKYLPSPFFMDFMKWESTLQSLQQQPRDGDNNNLQLLMGGLNGVFNLWMAELGGVFFHLNRAFQDTDMELPSRGLFLLMFVISRCCIWPMYLYNLFIHQSEIVNDSQRSINHFHKASVVVETGLFLTNLVFLYKNIAPILETGRMLPNKPKGFHRKWLDNHPNVKRVISLFLPQEKITAMQSSFSSMSSFNSKESGGDRVAGEGNDQQQKKKN